MVLNKVFWMTLVASTFAVLRVAFPDFPLPEELEAAIGVLATFIVGFFVKESGETVSKLSLKKN